MLTRKRLILIGVPVAVVVAFAVAAAAGLFSPRGPNPLRAKLDQVQKGMNAHEVTEVFGRPPNNSGDGGASNWFEPGLGRATVFFWPEDGRVWATEFTEPPDTWSDRVLRLFGL